MISIANDAEFDPAPQKGHGAKYHHKFEEAIEALLTFSTREQAAASLGISAKTLQRWLKIQPFAHAYQKARRERASRILPQLLQICPTALGTLLKIAKDGTSPAAKICAAESLLRYSDQATALEDVRMRLQAWERQQKQNPTSSAALPRPVEINAASPGGPGSPLEPKQEAAIAALMSKPTVEQAARAIEVDPKILQEWMRIAPFERELRKAYWERHSELTIRFQDMRPFAVITLFEQMRDDKVRETVRVRAANTLLQFTAQTLSEVDELPLRVQRLTQPQPQPIGSKQPEFRTAA